MASGCSRTCADFPRHGISTETTYLTEFLVNATEHRLGTTQSSQVALYMVSTVTHS
jgi:hypothetical protein